MPSYPPSRTQRDQILRVCLAPDEKRAIQAVASERGRSMSEIVRVLAVSNLATSNVIITEGDS